MSNDAIAKLESLAGGFRSNYLRYDELVAQLRAWELAFPELVRLRSIGTSEEGRALWVITIGKDADRARPSVWIDGNMHASELCGSSVALAIAEDALRLHLDPSAAADALAPHLRARLREVLFHVLPRMSPDGAECVLTEGRYVRSNPRDKRANRMHARWIGKDVDGDGVALVMRKRDETGEYVESSEVKGLLLPRRIEDPGPYYKVYPEGFIENFDGHHVPSPNFLSDNDVDLNRNFPWGWTPEPEQVGAGAYPASEPESRAVVDFITSKPEVFAWLNLHTFGGCFIRPLGHQPDKKMDQDDLALFRQIGEWCEQLTGYPMISGAEEFLYEPDKPLHGDLTDFGYHQRGAIAYVCELWDLFKQIGVPRKKPFVEHYTHLTREELIALGKWDAAHNASRVIRPWKSVEHPQLGEVEVGGIDTRVGLSNPPYERIAEICAQHSAAFMRVASLAPAVVIDRVSATSIGEGVHRIEATIENRGYLPTYVLSSAKKLPWNEPLHVDVTTTEGCTLATPGEAHREVGALDGWGRGLYDGSAALFYMRSRGSVSTRTMHWIVRGSGVVTLRVGSCRMGWIEKRVEV